LVAFFAAFFVVAGRADRAAARSARTVDSTPVHWAALISIAGVDPIIVPRPVIIAKCPDEQSACVTIAVARSGLPWFTSSVLLRNDVVPTIDKVPGNCAIVRSSFL
jgi:hypothetical protein